MASSFFPSVTILLLSLMACLLAQHQSISETCPDPSRRNPYDPRMGFNLHLSNTNYELHPRSPQIVAQVLNNIANQKIVWSRKVPIYVVDGNNNWDTYDVIYRPFSESTPWTTFRCPPAALIGNEIGKYMWDATEDWPFIIFDPNHPTHGAFVELRGFHTYIDHTTKKIYCEECGLFKYNNDGTILNPDGITTSDGTDFDGQGTGCGLSWPGVIRKDDVLSGTIGHAIRIAYSSCDFLPTTYVLPAVKTDQPKGVSAQDIASVSTTAKIEMGYRFRLASDTNCGNRLAPMYQNNGIWYPPTQQHTDFVRMFCTALKEYGAIVSDGSGICKSFIFQGENDITANWSVAFGSDLDESTWSWSYLIRDYTTPNDNRYRDERYGIPWHKLQVLNNSMVGEVNNCCLDSAQCTNTPAPTYTPYVDTAPGPACLNPNCCFKHRTMNNTVRINQDNCVVYNCTFEGQHISASDIISIYTKKDGNPAHNTLIDSNYFYIGTNMDAIDIQNGNRTYIYNNWFSDTGSASYGVIHIQQSQNTYISNNTFTGSVDQITVMIRGSSVSSNENTYIENNIFNNVQYGISIDMATNTIIKGNTFINMTKDGVKWKYYFTPTDESNGVTIQNNQFINVERGIYVGYDIGNVLIDNNIIRHTTNGNGIEFSGSSNNAIVSNNIITDIKHTCIYVNVNNNNMEVSNNQLNECHDASGIMTQSDNSLIKNNIIGNIASLSASGRGIWIRSYGTITGNLIYNVSRRAISTSGDYLSVQANEWIIENNIIYSTDEDSIHFYKNLYSPKRIIVRFNTVINDAMYDYTVSIPSTLSDTNSVDIYCNIFIANNVNRFFQPRSFVREYNNLKKLNTSYFNFVDDTNYNNLHLTSLSPAIAGCNGLNITRFSLPQYDYDKQIRNSNEDIDIGADQKSPIVPTLSPTDITNPTPEPTTCIYHDEGWSALSNDGEEVTTQNLIKGLLLFSNYSNFGIDIAKTKAVQNIAEYVAKPIDAKDDQLQYVSCSHIVSCLESPITMKNNSICSIFCEGLLSCGSVNVNIDSCDDIFITCFDAQSCDSANITITNASNSRININCGSHLACVDMKIDIIGNVSSTNITCMELNSCNNIEITVDDPENTLLFLYEYSSNVIFDNKAGFLSFDRKTEYVECNTKYKYIEWNHSLTSNDVQYIVEREYATQKYPCSGVTIKCLADLNDIVSNASCLMDFVVDSDYLFNLQLTLGPAACYWVSVEDLIDTTCLGACVSSPTNDPTAAPSIFFSSIVALLVMFGIVFVLFVTI